MRAVWAEAGKLELRETPEPRPRQGQLSVRVHAAGLNAADKMLVEGKYVVGASVRPPQSPAGGSSAVRVGAEAAGTVVEVGDGVVGWDPGDRVMVMAAGCFADVVVAEAGRTFAAPDTLSWAEAAGAPVTFATAHDALVTAGRFAAGDAVLVNAASSGVGVATLQLARLLGAGTVIAVSTSRRKLDELGRVGVPFDVGLVSGQDEVGEEALRATGGRGVDVVVDNVGAPAWADLLLGAAFGARVVSVGRLGGSRAEVDLDEFARKRLQLVGVSFRTRSAAQAAAVVHAAAADVVPGLADGRLRVLVDRTFPLEEAAAAEEYLATGRHLGKVVLLNGE